MMRILVLTNLYPNPYQPHRAEFNRQQFRALAAEHELRVIAPIAWASEWSARRAAARRLSDDRRRVADGMIIHHPRYLYTPKMLRKCYGRFLLQSVRACFFDAVQECQPDVVLGSWAYPDGWAAVQLAREARIPVAVKIHGSDLLMIDDQPGKHPGTSGAVGQADAVIAVSRQLGEQAVAMGADQSRVHVVYNGVDTNLFSPGDQAEARRRLGLTSPAPLILFAGNLVPVKGLDVLIEALASLRRSGCMFQCVLIGSGPLASSLESDVGASGLRPVVRLAGAVPLEKLPDWYRAADVFVLPSRSEGVPNVLLEAAACGTPYIASHVGGIPEIAPASALVAPGNAGELAARIRAAISPGRNPAPKPGFRPGSWADSAQAIAKVLQGVIAPSARRAAPPARAA